MRILSALAVLPAILMTSASAYAFDFDHLLKQAFGSSEPKDLGGLIFGLLAIVVVLFFWGALRIGKKRQRRMIENYDADMKDYSSRLRRGKF